MSPVARASARGRAASASKASEDGEVPTRHALWTGAIAFGLVEIPVELRAAVAHDQGISFSLLDRHDLAPVGYERVNKRTGKVVAWADVVKGFEHEPHEYVVLTDDEIRAANVAASQTIEILDFVAGSEIDSAYWETPYYVVPTGKRKSKAYALLREALERSGRVGIAQVVLRTRQRLAALLVRDGVVVLNVLRYAYELRAPQGPRLPTAASLGVRPQEIALAERLIASMTTTWKPSAYDDRYRDDILALVRKKVAAGVSKEIEPKAAGRSPTKRTEVLDLMPLLERSMDRRSGRGADVPERRTPVVHGKTARRRPA